jgi:hypothetical protein
MAPFAALLEALRRVRDPRRAQGQRYTLPHLLLFSVLAMLAGATSYRCIRLFILAHRERLNATSSAASTGRQSQVVTAVDARFSS